MNKEENENWSKELKDKISEKRRMRYVCANIIFVFAVLNTICLFSKSEGWVLTEGLFLFRPFAGIMALYAAVLQIKIGNEIRLITSWLPYIMGPADKKMCCSVRSLSEQTRKKENDVVKDLQKLVKSGILPKGTHFEKGHAVICFREQSMQDSDKDLSTGMSASL